MIPRNLGTKFSLLLVLVYFLGSSLTIFVFSKHLNDQAEQAVRERAEILLATMQAARDYTRYHLQPLFTESSKWSDDFVQEAIPNFTARTMFSDFRQLDAEFHDFSYKEATDNPTNPLDRADAFETKLFNQLKQQPQTTETRMLSGYRIRQGEKSFYLARPLVMRDVSCLECHGNPRNAPQPLLKMYGNENGFGWRLNDIVAAQMVYVPADKVFGRGRQNLLTITKTLLSIFGAVFIVINLLLWRTVIRPLNILTCTAKRISSCSVNQQQNSKLQTLALETLTIRRDEPGQLARAFQYMVHVLGQREQDLQQAVHEQTRSLAQEMRNRQAAQDALQTYSHAVNHDLRNLVMGISSLIQGILFRTARAHETAAISDERTPQTAIEIDSAELMMIQKGCDRQLTLMNSLMEVQSADVWRMVLQPEALSLRQLTEDLHLAYEPKLLAAAATLENHIPRDLPLMQADANQLQRVFENIIDNALKYNPEGVTIALNAALCQGDRPLIRCTIADDGIGVAAETGQALFNLYARGQGEHQAPGHGLGLYICRKIVEAHGGDIGVETSPKRGAMFWFTLPLSL
ncbi:MAG: DUF3365 domain-containing protein [Leptolyngbya sp. SIO1E4]|nr:DUF3365 domain-containing protein [Leptolyngbya sp. SIO1E4]